VQNYLFFLTKTKKITTFAVKYQLNEMKKTLTILTALAAIFLLPISCNNSKTMQERIQEEKKAIETYIARNRLNILTKYPADGVFGEKDFFKNSDGIYFHVVDSGNGQRAVALRDEIILRYESVHYIGVSDTAVYESVDNYPYSFIYGLSASYSSSSTVCSGWAAPLEYVGLHAVVDMILPSNYGNSTDRTNFNPTFYKGVRYTNFY
jgi:hypothetical protein